MKELKEGDRVTLRKTRSHLTIIGTITRIYHGGLRVEVMWVAGLTAYYYPYQLRKVSETVEMTEKLKEGDRVEMVEEKYGRGTVTRYFDVTRYLNGDIADVKWDSGRTGTYFVNRLKKVEEQTQEQFCTGAQRDSREGKGRYDLLPACVLRRDALRLEQGARHYGAKNWEKGIPQSRCLDSALRHILQYADGDRSEDHLAAARFNIAAMMFVEERVKSGELPQEMLDVKKSGKGT